jgi:hypothetical protein
MMATFSFIVGQIAILSVYYTYPERSKLEQDALASLWCEDLERITDDEFLCALKIWRKKSPYWPTPADIRKIVESGQCKDKSVLELTQFPSGKSKAEWEYDSKKIREIRESLAMK